MALFFDSEWFDARLAALGLKRGDLAAALGLDSVQLADLWKDQRELKASDVRLIAALIGASPAEVADRAGVSTPVPKDAPDDTAARLAAMEKDMAEIKTMLAALLAKNA